MFCSREHKDLRAFKSPSLITELVWVLSLFHSCYLVLDCCSCVFMAENSDWRSGNKALFLEPCGEFTEKTVTHISTLSSIVPAHINPIPTSLRLRLSKIWVCSFRLHKELHYNPALNINFIYIAYLIIL